MRATIKNYLEAEKARRQADGEKGFSLVELIIVVVILGILVAIAVPIFVNIQDTAEKNAVSAVAANGASAAAAAAADADSDVTPEDAADSAGTNGISATLTAGGGTTPNVSLICVKASKDEDFWAQAGPGCKGDPNSWSDDDTTPQPTGT